jgi:O-antigen ligase
MSFLSENLPPWRWLAALLPVTASFIYAPLAFGGTTFWTRAVIDWFLVHSFLLWVCILILERRVPRLPIVLSTSLGLLVFIGTLQFVNPRSIVDPFTFDFELLEDHLAWLPGTVDADTSGWILSHLLAVLLGGLFLRDGLSRSRVRWFLFRVVAFAGLVIALAGIYQKSVGTDMMLWGVKPPYTGNFFAAFRYHGNAASFLNLSWPAALVVWIRSRLIRPGGLVASLDLSVFFLVFGATFVNSSKAGLLLGLLGLLLAGWLLRREIFVGNTSRSAVLLMSGFVLVVGIIVVLPNLVFKLSKWSELFTKGQTLHGRLDAQRACLLAIQDTGLFGSGAGTFHYVFPPYKDRIDGLDGYWQHAHQDWFQGIIEWGWLGFTAWAVIFLGAMARLWSRIDEAGRSGRPELTASAAFLALALVLVHALADFPLQIPALQWLVVFHLAVAWSDARPGPRIIPAATD